MKKWHVTVFRTRSSKCTKIVEAPDDQAAYDLADQDYENGYWEFDHFDEKLELRVRPAPDDAKVDITKESF